MDFFTILSALSGGALIGLSAAMLRISHNRTAGISGIAAGFLSPWTTEHGWRLWFLLGLLSSAPLFKLSGKPIAMLIDTPLMVLAIAGLLVGFGTRMGGGCTSGHGICGIAQLSVRSIVATLTFMLTAGITVFFVRHLL